MKGYLKSLFILLGLTFFAGNKSWAQEELTLHFMNNVYQSGRTNPAFKPDNEFAFQFVNLYYNYYNTGFKLRDLSDAVKESSPGSFLNNKMQSVNYMGNAYSSDIFSMRFRVKSVDLTFGATQNVNMRVAYPKDLFSLVYLGNGDPYFLSGNKNAAFDKLGINLISYTEIWAGMAHSINEKLTYGIKYKFLIGQGVVNMVNAQGNIATNPNNYTVSGNANMQINTAGAASLNGLSNPSNYNPFNGLRGTGNIGHAVDLGLTYKVTEKLTINASALNIGFINWKDSVHNYSTNGNVSYSNLPFNKVDKSLYDLNLKNLIDTAKKTFNLKENNSSFTTKLTPQMYFSMMYNLDAKNRIGALVNAEYFNNQQLRAYYALGYTRTFAERFDLALTYSAQYRNYLNLGVGAAYHFPYFEAYAVTDNVVGFIDPALVNGYNVRVGINIVLGKGKKKLKDTDRDGVPDEQDICPTDSGLVIFRGCPDSDGDSIPDYQDLCPHEKGLAAFRGCPDSDGDGVPDYMDRCPHEKGKPEFFGCPDTDGDGIPDDIDLCKLVPGTKENLGCPAEVKTQSTLTKEETQKVADANNIEFEFGKSEIKSSSYPALDELSVLMTKKPNQKLYIYGYADNIGTKEANMKLSQARAETAKEYLVVQKGMDARRIKTQGFGTDKPIAPNDTPEGRAKNRRVEFKIAE